MPYYTFTNGKENKDIFFHMNDDKKYSENGVEWQRVFLSVNSSIDTVIDPFSSKQFVESSGRKKGSLNNLFEQSAELSEKRAKKAGIDPLKENYYKRYKKIRGKDHSDVALPKSRGKLNKLGVTYE